MNNCLNNTTATVKSKEIILLSNEEYKKNVQGRLKRRLKNGDNRAWLESNYIEAMSVYMVNFDPVHNLLRSLYANDGRGLETKDPQSMLRSLMLMMSLGEKSITKWVKKTRYNGMIRLFCGFEEGKTPGVGTYYDFKIRLENGAWRDKSKNRYLPSQLRKARSTHCLKPRKSKPKEKSEIEDQVVKKEKEKLIKSEKERLKNDFEAVLNEILLKVAVEPSAKGGIINDLSNLTVAIDGSTVKSEASHRGKVLCDCKKHGNYKCDCLRKYSDADAAWGYDTLEGFIWGYRFLQMVCPDNNHDLPLYLNIARANTFEPLMAMHCLDRFDKQAHKFNSAAKITNACFDALYDVHHFYRFLVDKKIEYAIPYKVTPSNPVINGQLTLNEHGVPICEGGLPMRRVGKNRQGRHVYNCPVKRPARRNGGFQAVVYRDECPLAALCQPDSKLGPIVSVPVELDPRLHPSIPRNSTKYKSLRNIRSTVERSNSIKKNFFSLGKRTTRVMSYAFIRLTLASILEHSRVWAKRIFKNLHVKDIDWLAFF